MIQKIKQGALFCTPVYGSTIVLVFWRLINMELLREKEIIENEVLKLFRKLNKEQERVYIEHLRKITGEKSCNSNKNTV